MNTIQKIFFWVITMFFTVITYSFTFGKYISFEIADRKIRQHFYHFIDLGFIVFLILTLVWMQRKSNSFTRKTTMKLKTFISFLIFMFFLVFLLFLFVLFLE